MGKQWVHSYDETEVKKDNADTIRRIIQNLDSRNTPQQRQSAVRMLAQQVRQGNEAITNLFINLLSDEDKDVQRLALDALSAAVAAQQDAATSAGVDPVIYKCVACQVLNET